MTFKELQDAPNGAILWDSGNGEWIAKVRNNQGSIDFRYPEHHDWAEDDPFVTVEEDSYPEEDIFLSPSDANAADDEEEEEEEEDT